MKIAMRRFNSKFKIPIKVLFIPTLLILALINIFVIYKNARNHRIFNDESDLRLSVESFDYVQRMKLTSPGHLGAPVVFTAPIPDDIQSKIGDSNNEFKFNEFVSRLIPLDRELPDVRQETCKTQIYAENLPKASIIVAYYNEPFSTLMRTVHSVLNRSPPELIEEIILVDDCSDNGECGAV